jgi:hypothetical protein
VSLPLYQLTHQLRELNELADSDEFPAETLRDTLDAVTGEIEVKARSIGLLTRNIEATAAMIRDAAKAMLTRADRLEKRAESIKAYLLFNMEASGITRIECPEFVIAVRKNPPSVVVDDEQAVPPEYFVEPPAPPPRLDKDAVKRAIRDGKDVPGVRLFQSERLEIKT